ncbi:MAG TPA: carboxylating nicotinate-nucleotide diphosphorylase [Nitrospiraceae bacterium]|nr:carboxylating nicotinate-nucleotide diphosphorylase [Nitrospiraceae bacterium]
MGNDLPLTYIRSVIENALSEDIGPGDITTSLLIAEDQIAEGFITAEEDVIAAGILVAEEVFKTLDPDAVFETLARDGESISAGTKIIRVHGKAKALLTGERVALNFLQRLSGIATLSRRYAEAVKGLPVRIVDTRKTTPGLRVVEKYAVRVGGCWNHRFGLFDGILIKENHIALTSGVGVATNIVRDKSPHTIKVEVEVKNLEEVREAAEGGADIIMLDNMDIPMMREAVGIIRNYKDKEIIIEASGGIGLDNVRNAALTGVDLISVGALTHSSSWVNISMDIFPVKS